MAFINWLTLLGQQAAGLPPVISSAYAERCALYAAYDAYYANTVYGRSSTTGYRDLINAQLGNASAADLDGLYNPLAAVVDLYLNVFGGRFGEAIPLINEGHAALPAALDTLWRWSNMDALKPALCRYPPLLGTAGIRIVARNHPDRAQRRVWLSVEHPSQIRDVELDDRDNVIGIELEYDETTGLGDNATTRRIREVQTKDTITLSEVKNNQVSLIRREPNALGLVSYVLVPFEQTPGMAFGRTAWDRVRAPLDRVNALLSHIDIQIHQHVRAKWLVAADGSPPTEFDMSDLSVVFINKKGGGSVDVQQLVANLDLSAATAQARYQIDLLESMLPELKGSQGTFLSNQSGDTVAALRQPAEDRILLARAAMESALIRAQQIALSWMILLDITNLGTGTGTREAADRAYQSGAEDHRFAERPAFLSREQPTPAATPAEGATP